MSIQLTAEQALTMAPDTSSASAGKKLASLKHWKTLGQSSEVLWGECQGSALYQVRVELSSTTIQCSCPSRKLPCKHGIGLLLLAINTPEAIPIIEHPEWVSSWLNKRAASSKRKEAKEAQPSSETALASQAKTAEKRLAQVTKGIERLDLWLNDLIRNGLGTLETQPATLWENQAAQLVDAQAPGLATRLRRMAAIPNSSPQWPEHLLAHLGQLALLTEAFQRLDTLDPVLQDDIRYLIGWNLKEDEVLARGEHVTDNWLSLGQVTEERERGRIQRIWLLATSVQRSAQVQQFAIANSTFPETYALGVVQQAEVAYWPGSAPYRILFVNRQSQSIPLPTSLPGTETIEAFLEEVATTLAYNPWREQFLCTLNNVTITYDPALDQWWVLDQNKQALPLAKGEYWQLLALSGNMPVDLAGEWNGETLLPLGFLTEQIYHVV